MASKPPSGASKLPDIFSLWSLPLKNFKSLVSLMTFWKENGASLSGHGSLSLRRWKDDREKRCHVRSHFCINFLQCVKATFSLLLEGSHVSLGFDHFVHKFPEANGVVVWQLLHQWSYRKTHWPSVLRWQPSQRSSQHTQRCTPSSWPILFKLSKSSAMELEKSMRI